MLATLNLQIAAVELPDDTLKTTAELLPSQGTEPVAGFADLLSLRVADARAQGAVSGDLLPLSGSQLPLTTDADSLMPSVQLPAVDDLATGFPVAMVPDRLIPVDATELAGDFDMSLESEVPYPPVLPGLNLLLESTSATPAAAVPLPADTIATPAAGDVNAAQTLSVTAGTQQTAPLPVSLPASQGEATIARPQRNELPTDGNVLRERPQIEMPRNAAPAAMDRAAVPQPEVERTLPVSPELQRRPDATASQRADALAQAVTELVRPRPIVNQAVQTLQSQLNAQQSPVFHTPVSAPVVATETTYASAMRQATDLIGTPVRDSAWGERLGERVVMMAGNQMRNAEIRLTPAELGPLRVQVAVEDGATHVTFHAQHALTRDAIEQALPRLRDMLAENGLSLGDTHVGEEGAPQGNRDGQSESESGLSSRSMNDGPGGDATESQSAAASRITGTGLVDTFA